MFAYDADAILLHDPWAYLAGASSVGASSAGGASPDQVVGALDDAGDGGGGAAAKGPTKRKKTFTADKILAGASMYEAIFNAPVDNMTEDELRTHMVRRKQVASIVDVCLASLKHDLGC